MEERVKLSSITLEGFKSFGKKQKIRFGDVTIFIGANGSGKSNVLSFFQMIEYMLAKKFVNYIATRGEASSFIFNGNINQSILANIEYDFPIYKFDYDFELTASDSGQFVFTREEIRFINKKDNNGFTHDLGTGQKEIELNKATGFSSSIREVAGNGNITKAAVSTRLSKIRTYNFSDTKRDSQIRKSSLIDNNYSLNQDGGNLASLLYSLKNNENYVWHYNRIVEFVKMAYPQFKDFILEPQKLNPNIIWLNWQDQHSPPSYSMSVHQLSDGTLRFIALATLLLSPTDELPSVIVLDEPELGLHPTAIQLLSAMITLASENNQVIIATQSSHLLDSFEPENIRVVERDKDGNSTVIEQDPESLAEWMETYSLGQIWEKNIMGGRP